jgi:glycosyltransferase involved in cell wall biosynthesis
MKESVRASFMKIIFVIQKLAGLKGGAERMIANVANAMAARGFNVQIVTFEMRSGPAAYALDPSITVVNLFPFQKGLSVRGGTGHPPSSKGHKAHRLERVVKSIPNVSPVTGLKWHLTHGFFARRLASYLKSERPDAAIGFLRPAITATAFAGKNAGIRVIASTHNTPWQDYDNPDRWDQNPIYVRKSREAFELADEILVLLPEFKAWFPDHLQKKITVMPNPVARISPLPSPAPIRQHTILGVGRLTRIKRFDLLIEAWSKLEDRYPGWRVKIFGEGDEHQNLQAVIARHRLEKSVTLAGVTNEIGPEYDEAMLLCHPAEFEGFGLSVAEALAHGLPVIGFADCPGVNSLISPPDNGILVSGDDRVNGLSAAMEQLISKPELLNTMSARAPESMARFAPSLIYDKWEALLRQGNS